MSPARSSASTAPWPDEEQLEHQARVHPGEEQVVAQIAEMRHAALGGAQVPHRHGNVERPYATPAQAHRRLSVEVEAPHPAAPTASRNPPRTSTPCATARARAVRWRRRGAPPGPGRRDWPATRP